MRLSFSPRLVAWDRIIRHFMADHATRVLRFALAVVFVWFGALKIWAESPADDLVRRTIYWLPSENFLPVLGAWEVIIGFCLFFRPWQRLGLLLLALQLPGTFLPLLLLPSVCFADFPFVLSMEGQYIVKNLLIIGAALVIGGELRPLPRQVAAGAEHRHPRPPGKAP